MFKYMHDKLCVAIMTVAELILFRKEGKSLHLLAPL